MPTYVPVIRTGVDVTFEDITATGTLTVTGATQLNNNLTVTGYTALQAGQADGQWTLWSGAKDTLRLGTAGGGIAIKEGADATSGVATLVAGTVTVNTNKVAADSRIQLTIQAPGGAVGTVYVSARTAGTSFTITSTSGTDTSQVAWVIISPAA